MFAATPPTHRPIPSASTEPTAVTANQTLGRSGKRECSAIPTISATAAPTAGRRANLPSFVCPASAGEPPIRYRLSQPPHPYPYLSPLAPCATAAMPRDLS
jgi:hypothetical protein